MRYAEVAVDAPVSHSRTFSYSIPDNFSVEPGQLVWVPFGRRLVQGLVVQLSPTAQVEITRDILQPLEPSPLVSPIGLSLGSWLSQYYFCSLFECLSLLLPPGFKAQVRSRVLATSAAEGESDALRPQTADAMRKLANTRQMGEGEFTHLLGRNGTREVNRLVDSGLVRRQVDLPRARTFHYQCFLIPTVGAAGEPTGSQKLSPRQAKLLEAVQSYNQGYPASLAHKEFGRPTSMSLVERGLLALEWIREERPPLVANNSAGSPTSPVPPLTLTSMQEDAVTRITQAITDSGAITDTNRQPRNFLLHGVTGSGKTEVYLRAMERVVSAGQQTIFLVPEISLTPQTVGRLNERFPGRVAVIHSRMKPREKFDQWWQIRDGEYDVVVGPRSALFAPVPDLGLIVIDEEHEWTYKQEEAQPLYDARTTSLELARLTGAVVVMGSATPDVETYYHASTGQGRSRTRLLELPDRIGTPPKGPKIAEGQKSALARVSICDMREELREGNRSIFSRGLAQALKECVNANHQAILFLNRRGSAPFVQCRDCGYVLTCPSCTVTLTFHSTIARLVCHRCNRRIRTPRRCRQCGGERIRQLGIGTQRVVDEVTGLLPGIRVERWDADSSRSGTGPEQTMAGLASGEIQVLVGTQMVAKGLDLPNVTLVGAILADVGLHLPDFRAGERAFSLLCQVAGRAGRGPYPGRVIIQTYNPEHYAIAAAATQDYSAMYRQEIQTRQAQGNPPFNQLAQIRFQDLSATSCQRQATALARLLRQRIAARGLADVEIAGPAPGIPERIRGHYRWNVLVRGRNLHRFLEDVRLPPNGVVDVDPAHLL